MPIKPENRKRYPSNWKDIRNKILKRANNRCEFCGVENHSYVAKAENVSEQIANNQRCHYGGSSKALPTISAGRGSNHIPFPLDTSGRDKPHQSHTGIHPNG